VYDYGKDVNYDMAYIGREVMVDTNDTSPTPATPHVMMRWLCPKHTKHGARKCVRVRDAAVGF